MSICHSIKTEYEALKALTAEFVSACTEASGPTALTPSDVRTVSNDRLRTLQLLKQRIETARDALKDKLFVSPEAAREIMGIGSYFGPEAVKTTHGVELNKKDLPHIPWSTQELKEAKDRGMMLILRIDKDANGADLTAKAMNNHCQPVLDRTGKGKALHSIDWYKDDPIYTEETCRSGWALVSKELLPTTISKDYVEQTNAIIDHITNTLLNNKNIHLHPKERTAYEDAIKEWHHYIQETFPHKTNEQINQELRGTNWQQYAKQLAELAITQLTRQRFAEAFSDILTVALNTDDQRLLETMWTWTSSRSSSGFLVGVGDADDSGARVGGWGPGSRGGGLGVLFVRSGPGVSRPS